jgi:hypothetical protein
MTIAAAGLVESCNHCGTLLPVSGKFCSKCGSPLNQPRSTSPAVPLPVVPAQSVSQSDHITTLQRMVAEHPGDESYQKLLAIQLHDDALRGWWKDPNEGQYLCTTGQQILHARRQLDRAAALTFNDPNLRASLAQMRHLVDSMEQREYTGNWFQVIILGFFGIFPGVIWWLVNRRPAFLINRDYVRYSQTGKHPGVGAKMGGAMEKVSDFFDSVSGGWGGWFALGFMVIFSPIFMIIAFKQNYLDVSKEFQTS